MPARTLAPGSCNRRRFLAAAAGVVGGCLVGRQATRPGRTYAFFESTSLSPGAPAAFLSTDTVPQGSAFSLRVQTFFADSAAATFNGLRYPLFGDGEYLVAVLGAGQPVDAEVEIEPGDYQVLVDAAGSNGSALTFTLPIAVATTPFPVDAIELPPSTAALLSPATVANELVQLRSVYTPAIDAPLWRGLFRWPVVGPITTDFGQARSYNGGPVSGHHSGVDIGVDLGTPVGAAAPGRIVFAGALAERGNMVAIEHGMGVFTGYAHLSRIDAVVGAGVAAGEIIGLAGSTGLSTGPHVHWECAVNGVHVDASRWTRVLLP